LSKRQLQKFTIKTAISSSTAMIPGASRLHQFADTLAAADPALDGELKKHLDELTPEYRRGDAAR
jgi:aryl-alcohol dehydrogenase-like predicted oxidoreductase